MLRELDLLEAVSQVRDRDIEAAARALGYLPEHHRKNYWRPLLMAAVLTALMAVTAVAATLLGRGERLAPMPPDESGQAQQAEIPNGFRGTPTYQGSARWWTYMAQWNLDHDPDLVDYSLDFIRGDLDRYLVCSLYGAYDPDQARTLYRIAEDYGLKLYREAIYFGTDIREFMEFTGVRPFLSEQLRKTWGGYVLEDGSFSTEFSLQLGLEPTSCRLSRYYAGSIYPFGGADRLKPFEETQYETVRGYPVFIDVFSAGEAEITYCDPQGETYISLTLQGNLGEPLEACRQAADLVDFDALCQRDTDPVLQLINQPTGAEKNPEAVKKLEAFQNSPVFQAGKEFQSFYEKNFYGPCFTGTYGLEGCEDIDAELDRLARTYHLTYARKKDRGNAYSVRALTFDNGAWQTEPRGARTLHYIPKDALYTMQINFLDIHAYRRIWEYETEEGDSLVLCTQGPAHSNFAGGIMKGFLLNLILMYLV